MRTQLVQPFQGLLGTKNRQCTDLVSCKGRIILINKAQKHTLQLGNVYVTSMKCPIFKTSCLLNVQSKKRSIYEMSYLLNVLPLIFPIIKCPIYVLSLKFIIYKMSCL